MHLKIILKNYYFIGLDHNEIHCSQALELGLVDEITESLEKLKECDIIFLNIPVDGIISTIQSFGFLTARMYPHRSGKYQREDLSFHSF